jgi:uncharacterized damage-inducible protein DinB
MAEMFQQAVEAGKVKGWKHSPPAFMGYCIAHEGYHLGEIGMTLKQAGHHRPLRNTCNGRCFFAMTLLYPRSIR